MVTAMALHFVWDGVGALSTAILGAGSTADAVAGVAPLGLMVLALLIVWQVFRVAVPGERAMMREILAPEVARGVIGEAEATAASGDFTARARYRKAGSGQGHHRRNRHVLEAVFDLASELGRSGGSDTERVEFSRDEVRRLRGELSQT